jgi:glycerol uptake facilitator-like aquaporin
MSNSNENQHLGSKETDPLVVRDHPRPAEASYENKEDVWTYLRGAAFEFVGIFFFVTCITYTMGNVNQFVFGFWALLVIFGGYSGGHVNPAVTLAFYVYEQNWGSGAVKLLLYWVAQFLGSACASKVSIWLLHKNVFVEVPTNSTTFEVFFSEFLMTGTFVFVILHICSSVTKLQNSNAAIDCGVIVGWFYCACQMGSKLSGSALNPAILFTLNGWDYISGNRKALEFASYMMVAELLGGLVFSLFFKYIFEPSHPNARAHRKDI